MLGGRRCCFIVFFAHNALLGVWSHALEAFSCKHQYEQVGKTTVLSPGPVSEQLSMAHWKYNDQKVADINGNVNGHQFSGRLSLDPKNFSLTIRELKTTDSGNFTFVSFGKQAQQRPTIYTRLIIQEVLTQPPTLTFINKTEPSNESCVVLMECSSKYDKDVNYSWTFNNVRRNGSLLQYRLKPQEGDTTFTCTVSNMVSKKESESKNINCKSSSAQTQVAGLQGFLIIAGVAFAVLVSIVVSLIICRYQKTQVAKATDELTVYAEIDDTLSSKIMKPCSVYEALEDKTRIKPKAQTVYDQIQFNRMQPPHN